MRDFPSKYFFGHPVAHHSLMVRVLHLQVCLLFCYYHLNINIVVSPKVYLHNDG